MTVDIKAAAEVVSAVLVVGGVIFAVIKWVMTRNSKDEEFQKEITKLKKENHLICKGLFACLDGLEQLGCNHTVPVAKKELDDYIQEIAHL